MRTLRDTGLVFRRYMAQTLHNPVWMVFGLAQPIMYLVLFAPLLKPLASVPGFPHIGNGSPYNTFVPGLLVQLGLFGASGVGFGLIAELRLGVIERMRVTPISRMALLLGRGLRDIVIITTQSLLLVVASIPFGLSVDLPGLVVALALIALIGLLTASLSYTVALAVKNEDGFAPSVFSVSLPLLLLSGVLLPMDFAPTWLQTIASFNPLKQAVDAARQAFNQNIMSWTVLEGVGIMVVMCVLAVALASRAFGRAVS